MMTRTERWWLGGAVAVIATGGLIGSVAIASERAGHAELERLIAHIERESARVKHPVPTAGRPAEFERRDTAARPANPFSCGSPGKLLPIGIPPGPATLIDVPPAVEILEVKAELDAITVRWKFVDAAVTLEKDHEALRRAAVEKLVVERRRGDGAFEQVAELDAKATSWVDREVDPATGYSYRIQAVAKAPARCGKCGRAVETELPGGSDEARTPRPYRVRLVGGDARVALLRVETYQGLGRWSARDHSVRPGGRIGPTGWRLEGLRFEKSTLTADVRDEKSGKIELSTKPVQE